MITQVDVSPSNLFNFLCRFINIRVGFLSKEYMYKSAVELNNRIAFVLLMVNILMVALTIMLIARPFFARRDLVPIETKPVETKKAMWHKEVLSGRECQKFR